MVHNEFSCFVLKLDEIFWKTKKRKKKKEKWKLPSTLKKKKGAKETKPSFFILLKDFKRFEGASNFEMFSRKSEEGRIRFYYLFENLKKKNIMHWSTSLSNVMKNLLDIIFIFFQKITDKVCCRVNGFLPLQWWLPFHSYFNEVSISETAFSGWRPMSPVQLQ